MVKLIDVHRHLWGFEWFPPSHLRNNAEGLAKKTGRTTEQVLERIAQSPTMDATGQIAIDEMEHYGIDHSVILALDWGMAYGPEEDNQLEYEEFDRLTEGKHDSHYLMLREVNRILGIDYDAPAHDEFNPWELNDWSSKNYCRQLWKAHAGK